MTKRKIVLCLALLLAALALATPASALVRFGHNVFIGGHDFSNQTYGPKRRAVITLYRHRPAHEGCVWRRDGHGGRVKICHLGIRPH
jgi:hypothetical protein